MAPGGKPSCLTTLPAVRHCQSQCEPTDSQTHLQSGGDLRCPDLGQSAWETGGLRLWFGMVNKGRQQEAAQGMTSMLRKKRKHKDAFHALSIGETQGKEVCYRRRYGKKKKEETQGGTRKNNQPTPKRPPHAPSLQGKKTLWDKRTGMYYASRMPRISATRLQDLFFCFLNHADDRRREPTKV